EHLRGRLRPSPIGSGPLEAPAGSLVGVLGILRHGFRRWRVETLKPRRTVGPRGLRFTIGDRNADVATALAAAFNDLDCVEVVRGDLLDVSPDAVVCPGNSFGDMGGGFDKAVDDFHRGEAQPAVVRA